LAPKLFSLPPPVNFIIKNFLSLSFWQGFFRLAIFFLLFREIGKLFLMLTKNDLTQGADLLAKNDISWGQANSTGVPPIQKSKQSRVTVLSLYKHDFFRKPKYLKEANCTP
jgi:hypothetical protein